MSNKPELLTQIPAFNTDYFVTGQAVKVFDNVKKDNWDGLIISRETDRIGIVKVEWKNVMCGSSGYEATTQYIYVQDIVNANFDIIKMSV